MILRILIPESRPLTTGYAGGPSPMKRAGHHAPTWSAWKSGSSGIIASRSVPLRILAHLDV